jgi:hypothetical protein
MCRELFVSVDQLTSSTKDILATLEPVVIPKPLQESFLKRASLWTKAKIFSQRRDRYTEQGDDLWMFKEIQKVHLMQWDGHDLDV